GEWRETVADGSCARARGDAKMAGGDDDKQSGIRSFSCALGPAPPEAPRATRPAPPYRLLIAGDFGIAEEGRRLPLSGDLAELLGEARPVVEVSAQNLLGSFPVTLS